MRTRSLLIAMVLLCTTSTFAQDTLPDPSPVVVTTFHVAITGTPIGFNIDSLIKIYVDLGIRPNTMIKNFRILRHWWGADNSKVLFVYEIDKFENIPKAEDKTTELINASMKNKTDQDLFWKRWRQLFNRHEDSIMADVGKPKM